MERAGQVGVAAALALATLAGLPARAAQDRDTPETALATLQSPDRGTRLRAVRRLKEAALPAAAVPLAPLLTDADDGIQLEAVWAELNIFLADKVVPRRRLGFFVELREKIEAEPIFSEGPAALDGIAVPAPVLTGLLAATTDDNPRVGVEALYAFGALVGQAAGAARRELQRTSGPRLAALAGSTDPTLRFGVARVFGRLYGRLGGEPPVAPRVGDIVVGMLNDREGAIVQVAMQALGAMRYDRAVQALTDLLDYYGRSELGTAALDALAHVAHPSSAAVLRGALTDRQDIRRALAVEGLARLGDRSARAAIDAALETESSPVVRLAAGFAAAKLADAPVDPLVDALASPRLGDGAREYLLEIAAETPAELAGAARHESAAVRRTIADLLGAARNAAARPLLDRLMDDADAGVAAAAARAAIRLDNGG